MGQYHNSIDRYSRQLLILPNIALQICRSPLCILHLIIPISFTLKYFSFIPLIFFFLSICWHFRALFFSIRILPQEILFINGIFILCLGIMTSIILLPQSSTLLFAFKFSNNSIPMISMSDAFHPVFLLKCRNKKFGQCIPIICLYFSSYYMLYFYQSSAQSEITSSTSSPWIDVIYLTNHESSFVIFLFCHHYGFLTHSSPDRFCLSEQACMP